jgi:hypothetical protein
MEAKDLIPIIISVLALVVSLGTFSYDQYQRHKQNRAEQARFVYIAYRLGSDLMFAWMPYILVGQGDRSEIEKLKADAIFLIGSYQGLADQLDLRLDLATLIKSYNPSNGDSLIGQTPFETVRQRIQTVHNKTIAAAFEIGEWLMFLHFVAGSTVLRNNADLNETLQIYGNVKNFITDGFRALKIREAFQSDLKTAEDIIKESRRLREKMDSILS